MRITFVSQPLSTGGAERVIAGLANKFVEMGHNIDIIIIDNGDENTYLTNPIINFYHIRKKRYQIFDLIYRSIKIRFYLNRRRPDIVIPFTTQKNVSVLLATIFSKHKVIISERNNPYKDPKNIFLRLLRKLLYFRASGYVFQTEIAKEYFSKKIQKKSCIIPNPITEELPYCSLKNRSKRIVMINRLEEEKNIIMAIDAFDILVKEKSEYLLDIYGKGSLKDILEHYINSKGLSNSVRLKGFSKEIHSDVQDAYMFLLTSNYEGISNSLIEAMGLGIPSISTDHFGGGSRSLIESYKNGILIPLNDVLSCYKAMTQLIEDKDLWENIANNSLMIKDTLSINRIANMWIQYIHKIAGEDYDN